MDEQLKQRLLGATVIVALAVIIVPELVKQPAAEGPQLARTDIPPRPAQLAEPPAATISLSAEQTTGFAPAVVAANHPGSASVLLDSAAVIDRLAPPPVAKVESAASASVEGNISPTASVLEQMEARLSGVKLDPNFDDAESQSEMLETAADLDRSTALDPHEAMPSDDQRVTVRPSVIEPSSAARATTPKPALSKTNTTEVAKASSAQAKPKAAPAAKVADIKLPPIQLLARAQSHAVEKVPQWMVQAGSFTVADNANLLRDNLRAKQFSASLSKADVGGRTVYRVRVGPHSTRAEGERTRQRLQREAGISGSVVPTYN